MDGQATPAPRGVFSHSLWLHLLACLRRAAGLLPLSSLGPPSLTTRTTALNPKPVYNCLNTNKHLPHPLCWKDTCLAFPLSTFSLRPAAELSSHCESSKPSFCFFFLYGVVSSFLNVIWLVKEYFSSWTISRVGQTRFKDANTGRDIKPRCRIIVRKSRVFMCIPQKADSERQWFGYKDLEVIPRNTERGSEEMKQGSVNKQMATLGNCGAWSCWELHATRRKCPLFWPSSNEEARECTYQLHSTALWLKTAPGH